MRPEPERDRRLVLTSALALALLLPACGDEASPEPRCNAEPSYAGEASDEAWYVMVDAYELAVTGHSDASVPVVPAESEALSGPNPVVFSWTSPLALGCPFDCFPEGHRLWPLMAEARPALFLPPAHAHLPPVTGDIHYVEVFVPGRECPIRHLTTLEDWRPLPSEWAEMRGKGLLELVITSAYLEKNRIAEGPYRSTRAFRIE